MNKLLVCWLGFTDLRAAENTPEVGLGPIAQAIQARPFDEAVLISDHTRNATEAYVGWLKKQNKIPVVVRYEKLSGPTSFGEIYEAAVRVLTITVARCKEDLHLTFHLSPGSPPMAAVWIIRAKTRFPAELIESSSNSLGSFRYLG